MARALCHTRACVRAARSLPQPSAPSWAAPCRSPRSPCWRTSGSHPPCSSKQWRVALVARRWRVCTPRSMRAQSSELEAFLQHQSLKGFEKVALRNAWKTMNASATVNGQLARAGSSRCCVSAHIPNCASVRALRITLCGWGDFVARSRVHHCASARACTCARTRARACARCPADTREQEGQGWRALRARRPTRT